MNELMSPHARSVLLGDRRCTATNRNGGRCGRASALGQFVCDKHGAKAPRSIQAARERLLAMVDPAMDALLRALRTGPRCETCGRSEADKDPVVIRAAQIILDRTGFGPSATVEVVAPNKFADLSEDELIDHLEHLLESARASRDAKAAYLLPAATDAVLLDDESSDDEREV